LRLPLAAIFAYSCTPVGWIRVDNAFDAKRPKGRMQC